MTDQQKNQAIADKCPGRFTFTRGISPIGSGWFMKTEEGWVRCLNGSIIDDLNAMQTAEDTLRSIAPLKWVDYEFSICKCSSSRQRADAFAKVLELW